MPWSTYFFCLVVSTHQWSVANLQIVSNDKVSHEKSCRMFRLCNGVIRSVCCTVSECYIHSLHLKPSTAPLISIVISFFLHVVCCGKSFINIPKNAIRCFLSIADVSSFGAFLPILIVCAHADSTRSTFDLSRLDAPKIYLLEPGKSCIFFVNLSYLLMHDFGSFCSKIVNWVNDSPFHSFNKTFSFWRSQLIGYIVSWGGFFSALSRNRKYVKVM